MRELETSVGVSISSAGTLDTTGSTGEEIFYSAVFSDELIANTKAIVKAGRITFLGKLKTKARNLTFAAHYPWIKVAEAEGARVEP